MGGDSLERCFSCNALISDNELVVNWGSCDTCFDKDYDRYLAFEEAEIEFKTFNDWDYLVDEDLDFT